MWKKRVFKLDTTLMVLLMLGIVVICCSYVLDAFINSSCCCYYPQSLDDFQSLLLLLFHRTNSLIFRLRLSMMSDFFGVKARGNPHSWWFWVKSKICCMKLFGHCYVQTIVPHLNREKSEEQLIGCFWPNKRELHWDRRLPTSQITVVAVRSFEKVNGIMFDGMNGVKQL